MNKCPYCGNEKKKWRDTCDSQECINKELTRFSTDYSDQCEVRYNNISVDGLSCESRGAMKKRHETL